MASKFDEMFDLSYLRSGVEEATKNASGEREEIPDGDYCVSVDRIALAETKNGAPAMKITFVIQMPEIRFNKRFIFYTQMMNNSIGISVALSFLRKLTIGVEDSIRFESFTQFEELCATVQELTKDWMYHLTYGTNAKGYKFYKLNAMEAI